MVQPQHGVLDRLAEEFDDDFGYETLVAGAVAGFASEVISHPFDTISHRAKMHPSSAYGGVLGNARLIIAQEGWGGVLAGMSVPLIVSAPSTAAYFGVYHMLKQAGMAITDGQGASAVIVAAGAAAEVAASILFLPAEVARARLQLGVNPNRATGGLVKDTVNFNGFFDAVRGIHRRQGLAGLWAGWDACLLQDAAASALLFLFYEHLRHMVTGPNGERPSMGTLFLVGGTAGAAAAGLTNPLDLITTRLMAQGEEQAFGRGIVGALRGALAEGHSALWRGTLPRMASAFPYAAIQFSLFEVVMAWLSPPEEPLGSEWALPSAPAADTRQSGAQSEAAPGRAGASSGSAEAAQDSPPKRRRRNTSSVFGFQSGSGATTAQSSRKPVEPPPDGELR